MNWNLNTNVRELARSDPVRLIATDTISEALLRLRGEAIGERILCSSGKSLHGYAIAQRIRALSDSVLEAE